jgi:hypothetical protein
VEAAYLILVLHRQVDKLIVQVQQMVGSLKMNTALEYSTRVVQEGDRRCKKSTLNDLAYLTPLRIPLMNPVSDGLVAHSKRDSVMRWHLFCFSMYAID